MPRPAGGTVGWHFVLADLALILFLVTLQGLAGEAALPHGARQAVSHAPEVVIAPAQALFRPVKGGSGITEWLAGQPRDPRATLTILAHYPPGGEQPAWRAAEQMAREAGDSGVAVRTILVRSTAPDLYASLAYDTRPPQPR